MKHTIEQVALAHKRDNQNNYKHHFFRCFIATDWALVLGSLHCNHLSLLWHSFFSGAFFCVHTFSHIYSKMHTVCSVFVFGSRLFYGLSCTSTTKSCAHVDVSLWYKTRNIPLFFWYCLVCFIWMETHLFVEREKRENEYKRQIQTRKFHLNKGVAHND